MNLKIDEKDCLLEDLKIPADYRVIEDYELMKELRTNKELQEIFKTGIWVNRVIEGKVVIRASWLSSFSSSSYFNANVSNVGIDGRVRGVFVKIEKEGEK